MQHNALIHLISGGIGGTTAAIVTCPLEVVKTRLQSSILANSQAKLLFLQERPSILRIFGHIIKTEGVGGLFKGVGPTLVGIIPARAIYFGMYAKSKNVLNSVLPTESSTVHGLSAISAGAASATLTNPIWFIKTRIQLKKTNYSIYKCIVDTLKNEGPRGFFRGLSASYYGLTETALTFILYEHLKKIYNLNRNSINYDKSVQFNIKDIVTFMGAAISAKSTASIIAYPHEVARTRLRERGNKYKSFWPTLVTVAKEEGFMALYRGLGTHLIRNIPNTVIIMSTYETCVYLMNKFVIS